MRPDPIDAKARAAAIDVRHSAIVQAPAGSGKTSLLVERFLELLTVVDRPEEILAITFTRKAAGEMQQRIAARLMDDGAIGRTLRARSAALGWHLAEQPSRLRIQTIDAFAAGLVRRMPSASALAAEPHVLEDSEPLYLEALDRVFDSARHHQAVGTELIEVLALFDNDYARARASLATMLARRDQWLEVAAVTLAAGAGNATDVDAARRRVLTRAIDAAIESLQRSVIDDVAESLDDAQRLNLAVAAAGAARRLGRAWAHDGLPATLDGWRFVADLVATEAGRPRVRLGREQGFGPRTDATEKLRLKETIDSLATAGLVGRIAALRRLPTTPIERDHVDAIIAVVTVLSFAAIELGELFRRERAIDFTELTLAAHRSLGTADAPSDVALALDYRIRHVLVDEFQDTSVVQFRLLTRLIEGWQRDDGRTLFLVGDPMQSIYRFRDADVALFQRSARHGIGALPLRSLRLTANFRATAPLVDWCNRAFAGAFGTDEDPILGRVAFAESAATVTARDDDGARACLVDSRAGPNVEASTLVTTIERLRRAHPGESVAVLARSRNHLDRILPELTARGIEWTGTDIDVLAQRSVIDDLMSLLRALSSDADRLAWLSLLRAPFIGLTLRDLECVAQLAAGPAALLAEDSPIDGVSDDGRARLDRMRGVLRSAIRQRGQRPTRQWLESTFIRLGGADAYEAHDALANAQRLFDLIDDEHSRTPDLSALQRAITRLFADAPPRPGAIDVMTIHRAKGLEFDHVLLPGLSRAVPPDEPPTILWRNEGDGVLLGAVGRDGRHSGVYEWLRHEARHRESNERVRLLYVAATRARRSLHLFATVDFDADVPRSPPPRSLIAPLWAFVARDAHIIREPEPSIAAVRSARDADRVLPAHYAWRPARDIDDIAPLRTSQFIESERPTPLGERRDVAAAGVVHRMLRALSRHALPDSTNSFIDDRRAQWRARLVERGIADPDLSATVDEIAGHVARVLADPHGRWILEPHDAAQNDATFVGRVEDRYARITIDRTFIDPADVRWAIGFETARPHAAESVEQFLDRQRLRWGDQLRRARTVLAQLDARTVRAAIYFTALPTLLELEPTLAFAPSAAENPPS